jgi:hypothetical protein
MRERGRTGRTETAQWSGGVVFGRLKERNEEEIESITIHQYVCEVSVGWSSLFLVLFSML